MPPSITSVTTPVNYRLVRQALLASGPFTQTELAERAEASVSQANRIVRWLVDKGHAERGRDGLYRNRAPVGIITSVFPYQRTTDDALAAKLKVRGSKQEVKEALVDAGGVLCLESAAEEYGEFFRADRVCVYHENPEQLVDGLRPHEGGVLPVWIYTPDIPLDGDVEEDRRTARFRTVVDLACDGKLYAAKDLIEELWGVVLD